MNARIMLLLLLGVSLALFGCAKKTGPETESPPQGELVPEGEVPPAEEETPPAEPEEEVPTVPPEQPPPEVPDEPVEEPESDDTEPTTEVEEMTLVELFQIDTDKPIGDEGLDADSPSAHEE